MNYIPIKRIGAHTLPVPAKHRGDAGWDLRVNLPDSVGLSRWKLGAGEKQKLLTGFAWDIPKDMVGVVVPRSGLGSKQGIVLANGTGIIDTSYIGEIMIVVHNTSNTAFTINDGDRLCQMMIVPCYHAECVEVGGLMPSSRNDNGFGSSGVE